MTKGSKELYIDAIKIKKTNNITYLGSITDQDGS